MRAGRLKDKSNPWYPGYLKLLDEVNLRPSAALEATEGDVELKFRPSPFGAWYYINDTPVCKTCGQKAKNFKISGVLTRQSAARYACQKPECKRLLKAKLPPPPQAAPALLPEQRSAADVLPADSSRREPPVYQTRSAGPLPEDSSLSEKRSAAVLPEDDAAEWLAYRGPRLKDPTNPWWPQYLKILDKADLAPCAELQATGGDLELKFKLGKRPTIYIGDRPVCKRCGRPSLCFRINVILNRKSAAEFTCKNYECMEEHDQRLGRNDLDVGESNSRPIPRLGGKASKRAAKAAKVSQKAAKKAKLLESEALAEEANRIEREADRFTKLLEKIKTAQQTINEAQRVAQLYEEMKDAERVVAEAERAAREAEANKAKILEALKGMTANEQPVVVEEQEKDHEMEIVEEPEEDREMEMVVLLQAFE
jgi:hypothetical protein